MSLHSESRLHVLYMKLRMNALAYPFLGDGIPITYSGAEQSFTGGGFSPSNSLQPLLI